MPLKQEITLKLQRIGAFPATIAWMLSCLSNLLSSSTNQHVSVQTIANGIWVALRKYSWWAPI